MVQRKAPNKLGILADSKNYVKPEKWSLALKSSSQHQDVQDKGATELKKKEMKKSRSIKLLDLENLEPPPTRRPKLRFQKLPTNASSPAVTPPAPSIKKQDPSLNYMKPTSSSDAKKPTSSSLSLHGYRTSCPRKSLSPNPSGRNSNRISPIPRTNGWTPNRKSPGPSPSGRNSHGTSLSPSPNGRNSYRMSLSPDPGGRNSHGNSQCPRQSGRNSYHNSQNLSPSVRNSHFKSRSPCPSGRNPHGNSLSPSPSGRNSYHMSTSPTPSGRTSYHNSLSRSLSKTDSDNSKPCSASGQKQVKTSMKTSSLKPVRTLTKTPSFKGGTELKKQIKKSISIKLLDLESLESSPMEQTKVGFDESPANVSSAAVTPQEPSLTKTPYLLPNYMKPTNSSDARKDHLQVSTLRSQTSCPSKSPNKSNLIHIEPSFASGHKPSRTLMKASSLKPVRTLVKTSSLKLARPSMKKSPDIALCSSLNVGRATCSSTLKDSKFPAFLTLGPAATESEGSSAMKVCPYTYCSLNGHHHTPLPLLKHFLSARRRLLKTQKSLRLKNLSPLGKKPPGERKKETDMDRIAFNEDPTAQVADLTLSTISPVIKDDGIDFFVEIYARPREDTAMPNGRSIQDGYDEENIPDGIISSVIHGTEIETENDAGKILEKPDELPYSDMSLQGNIHQNSNLVVEIDIPTSQRDQFTKVQYAGYQSCFIPACCCIGKELEGQSAADTELEESSIGATDMGREVVAPPTDSEPDLMPHLPESKSTRLQEEPDDIVNDTEEFPVAGLVQKHVHTENAQSLSIEYGDDHSETNAEDQSFWPSVPSNVSGEVSGTSSCPDENLFYSSEVASEEPTTIMEERDRAPKPDETFNSMAYSASVDDPPEELTASSDEKDKEPQPENLPQEHPEPIPITHAVDDPEGKKQGEDTVEHDDHGGKSSHTENSIGEEETVQVEENMESDTTETIHGEDNFTSSKEHKTILDKGNNSNQQLPTSSSNLKRTMRCRKPIEDQEEPRKFNPREPQYLDVEPEPEPEKVDLRHQMMDEKKNSEDWMLDYALQAAVSKLAPARKQKVPLLVEAFETVIPPPKCETHLPDTSAAFSQATRIQACN